MTPTKVTTYGRQDPKRGPARAVDKDIGFTSLVYTENGGVSFNFDFDKIYFISEVTVYFVFYTDWFWPNDWFVQSLKDFEICVDENNNVDVSVYKGDVQQKSCGTLQLTYGLEQSDQIYTLICNSEGDTVKLSKNTGKIQVCEVVVLSKAPGISGTQGKNSLST